MLAEIAFVSRCSLEPCAVIIRLTLGEKLADLAWQAVDGHWRSARPKLHDITMLEGVCHFVPPES